MHACDRFLQMIFWQENDKLRSNKLLSCTKGNTLLNWIQKENLYCSVLYKKEDYKEREREHSLKRERTTENKCPPRACNIYGMMFRSSPWRSSATLQTLRVPVGMWTDLDHHFPCIVCIQNSRKPKSPLEHEIYSNISYTWDAVFALLHFMQPALLFFRQTEWAHRRLHWKSNYNCSFLYGRL